jgi:hypothetical protein
MSVKDAIFLAAFNLKNLLKRITMMEQLPLQKIKSKTAHKFWISILMMA